jgi:SAM-dependent methyltransferase
MDKVYPEFFAKYYDDIYQYIRDSVDHKFFIDQISKTKGKILEAGTGTGRFLSEAVALGADIYGIDISPAMLDVLKNKVPAEHHHRVSLQSIVDFNFDWKFSLILAPFRTFMHLITEEEQMQALVNVYDHLEPGGQFIFDAFIPNLNILQNGIKEFTDFDAEVEPGLFLKRVVNAHSNLVERITYINFRFEFEKEGKITKYDWNSPLRVFFRWELENLMKSSPFSDVKIYGDYKFNPIGKNSKDFVVVCQK